MEKKTVKILVLAIVVAVLVMIGSLVGTSLKKLDSFEVGLQYDTIQKTLGKQVKNEGLHLGPPGFQMIKFPNVFETITFIDQSCLNFDGVTITLDVSYQYKVRSSDLYALVTQFKDHETYLEVLQSAGTASLQVVCSNFDTENFQTNRTLFQSQLKTSLQKHCEPLSCDINDVQVNDIRRPQTYESAIRIKQAAAENVEVIKEEREKDLTKANTELREAKTTGEITIQAARSKTRILDYQGETEAAAIIDRYGKEAQSYSSVSTDLQFTTEGLISYIGIRTIEKNPNSVYVSLRSPAKSSYVP